MDSIEGSPGLISEIAQLRAFVQSQQVQKAHNLTQILRDEFPTERSLDDPHKLSDALQKVIIKAYFDSNVYESCVLPLRAVLF